MQFITGTIVSALIGVLIFFLIPLIALLYGVSAWVMGYFFGDTIATTVMQLFNTDVDLRQVGFFNVGVTLGFLGGYVRSTLSGSTSSK